MIIYRMRHTITATTAATPSTTTNTVKLQTHDKI